MYPKLMSQFLPLHLEPFTTLYFSCQVLGINWPAPSARYTQHIHHPLPLMAALVRFVKLNDAILWVHVCLRAAFRRNLPLLLLMCWYIFVCLPLNLFLFVSASLLCCENQDLFMHFCLEMLRSPRDHCAARCSPAAIFSFNLLFSQRINQRVN